MKVLNLSHKNTACQLVIALIDKFVGIDRVNSILISGDEIEIDVSTNWEGQKLWVQRRFLPFYLTVFFAGIFQIGRAHV